MKDLFEKEKGIFKKFFFPIIFEILIITFSIFIEKRTNNSIIEENDVISLILYSFSIFLGIIFIFTLIFLLFRILNNVRYFKIHFPQNKNSTDEFTVLRKYYFEQPMWCFSYIFFFIVGYIGVLFPNSYITKFSSICWTMRVISYIRLMLIQRKKINQIKKHIVIEE